MNLKSYWLNSRCGTKVSIIYEPDNERKGLVFVKIPRTAGGSVKELLFLSQAKNGFSKNELRNRTHSRGSYKGPTPYTQKRCVKTIAVLNSGEYNVFTIVRNPWDRFISSLAYCANNSNTTFEEKFLDSTGKLNYSAIQSLYRGQLTDHIFFHVFATMKEQTSEVKNIRILRYENLYDDLKKYFDFLNLDVDFWYMGTHNKFGYQQKRKKYNQYYTDESINFVKKVFKEDIETFKYVYEG